MDYDIVASATGQQLGIDYLAGVINIIINLDTKLLFKLLYQGGVDVVGLVVDIEDGFFGAPCQHACQQRKACNEQGAGTHYIPSSPRRARALAMIIR